MLCCSFTVRAQLGNFRGFCGLRSVERWRTPFRLFGSMRPRSCATCRGYVLRSSREGPLKTNRIRASVICFSGARPRARESAKHLDGRAKPRTGPRVHPTTWADAISVQNSYPLSVISEAKAKLMGAYEGLSRKCALHLFSSSASFRKRASSRNGAHRGSVRNKPGESKHGTESSFRMCPMA